jgi:hypothetical protein
MAKKTIAETVKKAAPAKKNEVYIQYDGKEVDVEAVVAEAKAQFKAEMGRKAVKTCQVYVKPQENAAYFVINDEFSGKVEL